LLSKNREKGKAEGGGKITVWGEKKKKEPGEEEETQPLDEEPFLSDKAKKRPTS